MPNDYSLPSANHRARGKWQATPRLARLYKHHVLFDEPSPGEEKRHGVINGWLLTPQAIGSSTHTGRFPSLIDDSFPNRFSFGKCAMARRLPHHSAAPLPPSHVLNPASGVLSLLFQAVAECRCLAGAGRSRHKKSLMHCHTIHQTLKIFMLRPKAAYAPLHRGTRAERRA